LKDYSPAIAENFGGSAETHGIDSNATTYGDESQAETFGNYSSAVTEFGKASNAFAYGYGSEAYAQGTNSEAKAYGNFGIADTTGADSEAYASGYNATAETTGKYSDAWATGPDDTALASGPDTWALSTGPGGTADDTGSHDGGSATEVSQTDDVSDSDESIAETFDYYDPIILDLHNTGLNLLQLPQSTASLSYEAGQTVRTAWMGPNDGALALVAPSADGNGIELDFTRSVPGTTTDLQALEQGYDSNHNGELDPGDASWSSFDVWTDSNQNGVVDTGELAPLAQAGISSIDLSTSGGAQSYADGSSLHGTGSFTRADGSHGQFGEFSFATAPEPGTGSASTTGLLIPTAQPVRLHE
jgi:hypothetical protein